MVVAAAATGLVACSGSSDQPAVAPLPSVTTGAPSVPDTEPPTPEEPLSAVGLSAETIAEVDQPTALAARPSSPNLYIAEKDGTVRVVKVTTKTTTTTTDNSTSTSTSTSTTTTRPATKTTDGITYELQTTPILDISDDVINEGERGLLGITFSTDGRRLYVNYTAEPDGRIVVAEYSLGDGDAVDIDSRREIFTVAQPYPNHNGGQVVFGPDGYLYIGLGDGGALGDPDQQGQNPKTLLGTIVRIDPEVARPDASDTGGDADEPAYVIPPGNPFADGQGGQPAVWAYGLRNPWRFSFDRANGDLWIGDVGESAWEEVDYLPSVGGFDAGRGANLGWSEMEGTRSFNGGQPPPGAIPPVYEYAHAEGGCSIIGGYVYRGKTIAALEGAYLFADYCAAGVRAIRVKDATVIDQRTFPVAGENITSFGQDRDGELFVLLDGGAVVKLVPE